MSYTFNLDEVLDEPVRRLPRPLTAADRQKLYAAGKLVPPDPKSFVKAVDYMKKARVARKLAAAERAREVAARLLKRCEA